jgi:radical SAM superfamily enzyme YgiQ (UPF0313 family)
MKKLIAFCDLAYTGAGMSSNAFPYAVGIIASHLKKKFADEIDVELFKYPDDFTKYLEKNTPKFICFTNYSWTFDLSHEFAKQIKKKHPGTISIFGGPNYPIELDEQKKFLLAYPGIDFYVKGEGEVALTNLYENLKAFSFNAESLKKEKLKLGNCHYISDNELIVGPNLERILDLGDTPSPYLTGLLDKFFDKHLIPGIQTSRGCPFKCSFCQEGKDYFTKICKYSLERIISEIDYIAERVKNPNLYILDSNFGMYKQDIEVAKHINKVRQKEGWPKYLETALGKSKKVMEVITILEGGLSASVATQSTDPEVLENVKRRNVPEETAIEIINHADQTSGNSFAEMILCLPGDTRDRHFKSMFDMIDKGANVVRSHQLLMLPDSEMYTKAYRSKFGLETRFRLQPNCFQNYKLYGEEFACAEIDELCVSNNTMTHEGYLEGRFLNLTVEIFYNNGVFKEYINFLEKYNIKASSLVKRVNEEVSQSNLKTLYDAFIKENKTSLWRSREELEKYIKAPGNIKLFKEQNLRPNEQLTYRAMAFFSKMQDLHTVVLKASKELLEEKSALNSESESFLSELTRFSLLRKNNLLSLDETKTEKFAYDFTKNDSPFTYSKNKSFEINFSHTVEQKKVILNYIETFGGKAAGNLGAMLSRSPVNSFYRNIEIVN